MSWGPFRKFGRQHHPDCSQLFRFLVDNRDILSLSEAEVHTKYQMLANARCFAQVVCEPDTEKETVAERLNSLLCSERGYASTNLYRENDTCVLELTSQNFIPVTVHITESKKSNSSES